MVQFMPIFFVYTHSPFVLNVDSVRGSCVQRLHDLKAPFLGEGLAVVCVTQPYEHCSSLTCMSRSTRGRIASTFDCLSRPPTRAASNPSGSTAAALRARRRVVARLVILTGPSFGVTHRTLRRRGRPTSKDCVKGKFAHARRQRV